MAGECIVYAFERSTFVKWWILRFTLPSVCWIYIISQWFPIFFSRFS